MPKIKDSESASNFVIRGETANIINQSRIEDEFDEKLVHKVYLNTIPEQSSYEIKQEQDLNDDIYVPHNYSDTPRKSI